MQNRHDLEDYNVPQLVDVFIKRAVAMAAVHKGNFDTQNIMWLMGSDFMYEDAEIWFINLDVSGNEHIQSTNGIDRFLRSMLMCVILTTVGVICLSITVLRSQKIIRAVNANGTVHARYSTPSEYVTAKLAENITYSIKTDDHFPYISDPQSAWTGFFTSRPGLKGYVRSSSVLLMVARQLEVLAGGGGGGNGTERLWEALSVAQHHVSCFTNSKCHLLHGHRLASS